MYNLYFIICTYRYITVYGESELRNNRKLMRVQGKSWLLVMTPGFNQEPRGETNEGIINILLLLLCTHY